MQNNLVLLLGLLVVVFANDVVQDHPLKNNFHVMKHSMITAQVKVKQDSFVETEKQTDDSFVQTEKQDSFAETQGQWWPFGGKSEKKEDVQEVQQPVELQPMQLQPQASLQPSQNLNQASNTSEQDELAKQRQQQMQDDYFRNQLEQGVDPAHLTQPSEIAEQFQPEEVIERLKAVSPQPQIDSNAKAEEVEMLSSWNPATQSSSNIPDPETSINNLDEQVYQYLTQIQQPTVQQTVITDQNVEKVSQDQDEKKIDPQPEAQQVQDQSSVWEEDLKHYEDKQKTEQQTTDVIYIYNFVSNRKLFNNKFKRMILVNKQHNKTLRRMYLYQTISSLKQVVNNPQTIVLLAKFLPEFY